ncbi:MAG: reverse transcriptase/maturase family protein [Nanoarchaeota archaeon]|nr:reverse transcriptase/maturase family protein [Nanoarchaeota archaeon]
MKTYKNIYKEIYSFENLYLAYKKAKQRKSNKFYVIDFEKSLFKNLVSLHYELKNQTYKPQPFKTFIIRDPKTRKISKSAFRDRIVHHALCNIIEPIFEKIFIFDSYANRKKKGVHKAIQRFDMFKRKVSKNNTRACYILKADIKHYFDEVNHKILIDIINKKIKDEKVIWLIKVILENHKTKTESKGMPLGNLTSQFFANVYLNELDNFVKRELRARYYIRYVDDIAIFSNSKEEVENVIIEITKFLRNNLDLELHKEKTKIKLIHSGIKMLGYRIYYYHKLLRKSNLRKFKKNFTTKINLLYKEELPYENLLLSIQGWFGYAMWANTYKLRQGIYTNIFSNTIR